MASEFAMPKLGLTMTEAKVNHWRVEAGTAVTAGTAVAEIETDKVETEIEVESDGIFHPVATIGETYACGELLAWLLEEGEEPPAAPAPSAGRARPSASASGASHLDAGADSPAEPRQAGGRAAASPRARRMAREAGIDLTSLSGSGPDGRIVVSDVEAAVAAGGGDGSPSSEVAAGATPIAVLTARRLGVDLAAVRGTAPDGRITRADVERARAAAAASPAAETPAARPPATAIGSGQRIPVDGMRSIIADRMSASLAEAAQLTLMIDVDMDAVVELRRQLKDRDGEVTPSYTDFVIAASARALRAHPAVNAQMLDDDILLLDDVNVGVAVAVDGGLVVPVVHGADRRSLDELASETARLAAAARAGRLQLSEIEGGTFSVTSLGMFGVDGFTPIINPPNAAILGVGRLRTDTAWDDDTPRPVKRLTLSLTWDHRMLDGAPAAEFANAVGSGLASPAQLLEPA